VLAHDFRTHFSRIDAQARRARDERVRSDFAPSDLMNFAVFRLSPNSDFFLYSLANHLN